VRTGGLALGALGGVFWGRLCDDGIADDGVTTVVTCTEKRLKEEKKADTNTTQENRFCGDRETT